MAHTGVSIGGGSVDPETLYTKQNCIGMSNVKRKTAFLLTLKQVGEALGRYTKGKSVTGIDWWSCAYVPLKRRQTYRTGRSN